MYRLAAISALMCTLSACADFKEMTRCEQAVEIRDKAADGLEALELLIGDYIDDVWLARLDMAQAVVEKAELAVVFFCAMPISQEATTDAATP